MGDLYILAPDIPYIYKIGMPVLGLSVYMYVWDTQAIVGFYIISRRGQALRCLSFPRGNAKA